MRRGGPEIVMFINFLKDERCRLRDHFGVGNDPPTATWVAVCEFRTHVREVQREFEQKTPGYLTLDQFYYELSNSCYASWGEGDHDLRTDKVRKKYTLNGIDASLSLGRSSTRFICGNIETLL